MGKTIKSEIQSNLSEEVYTQVAHELVWEISSSGFHSKLEVISESMIPFLMLGDKVIVQKIQPESLKIGDLIVISRKNEFITHRLVRKGNRLWVTKGDHYHHFDPPVPKQAILGKVIVIDRKGQMINLQTNFWKGVNRFLGWENWIQGLIYRYLRAVKNQLRFTR